MDIGDKAIIHHQPLGQQKQLIKELESLCRRLVNAGKNEKLDWFSCAKSYMMISETNPVLHGDVLDVGDNLVT